MNNKIRNIGAALLAAVMCAALAGCSQSGTSNTSISESNKTQNSKPDNSGQSSAVSKPESENASDNNSTPEAPPSDSDEITLAATDEILNAKFDSGLVQFYNDVFQCGGYLTVAEFIEKYKSSYDFSYGRETIDKEVLSKTIDSGYRDGELHGESVVCEPKFTVKDIDVENGSLIAIIVNPSDDPVQLSECYVSYVKSNGFAAYWLCAGGFCGGSSSQKSGKYLLTEEAKKNKENEKNPDFIDMDVEEYLRSIGYEEIKSPSGANGYDLKASMEYNNKYFTNSYGNTYYFYNVGEPNAFGARPFYRNSIGLSDGKLVGPNSVDYIFE